MRKTREMKQDEDGRFYGDYMPMFDRRHLHMMRDRPRRHPMIGHRPHPMTDHISFPRRRMNHVVEDIENIEEALEYMDYRKKVVNKQKQRLRKRLEELDILETLFDQSMKDIARLEEYSPDEMRKILKKTHREYRKKVIDLED